MVPLRNVFHCVDMCLHKERTNVSWGFLSYPRVYSIIRRVNHGHVPRRVQVRNANRSNFFRSLFWCMFGATYHRQVARTTRGRVVIVTLIFDRRFYPNRFRVFLGNDNNVVTRKRVAFFISFSRGWGSARFRKGVLWLSILTLTSASSNHVGRFRRHSIPVIRRLHPFNYTR